MSKSIKTAVIQLDASPAPVAERLAKAGKLIAQCVELDARLIVLPEVFNTGYEYSDQNYIRAESLDGLTATWMTQASARYQIHLAGSFLRKEQNAIFNTMLLVAPDGRRWHYDKNYPWMWERAYFQKGTEITVADTEFGKVGLLICWDVAHPKLWQQYRGKVELIIVSSCPPKAFDLSLVFPNGERVVGKNAGALIQYLKRTTDKTFGEYLRTQASSLGIPVAHATSTGTFCSSLPKSKTALAMLSVIYPPLWKHKSQFARAQIETDYFNETYIADSSGVVLQSVPSGSDGFAISEVILPDASPDPKGKQPPFGIPKFTYLIDSMADMLLDAEYRKKLRRYLAEHARAASNSG